MSRRLLLSGMGSVEIGLAASTLTEGAAEPVDATRELAVGVEIDLAPSTLTEGAAEPVDATRELAVGPVTVTPNDSRYQDLLLRRYNKRLVSRPDSVRVVGTTAQVIQAVASAVGAAKRIAVRGGGHCLDALVDNPDVQVIIDFTEMRSVTFDTTMNAFLVEPGATLGQVYRTLDYGWGVTLPGGVCPDVGAGGHIPGNGFGALSRQYGLIADHLYALEVVVVDATRKAKAVVATRDPADPNQDLWWAHTGAGGGNFGVVTRYWMRSPNTTSTNPSHLLPKIPSALMTGQVVWNWSDMTQDAFVQLARNFGTWMENNSAPGAPGTALYGAFDAPRREQGQILVFGQVDPTVTGNKQLLDNYLVAMTRNVRPSAQIVKSGTLPWLSSTINVLDSAVALGVTGPSRWKSKVMHLKKGMTDAQIVTAYGYLTRADYSNPAASFSLTSYGGQINALAPTATATPHRQSVMLGSVSSVWDTPADDPKHLQWTRAFFHDLFADTGGVPVPNDRTDGLHPNWPDADLLGPPWNTSTSSVQQLLHKDNYPKLQQIKAKSDPRNVFRHAVSIQLP